MLTKDDYVKSVELLNIWADSYYNKGVLIATDDEYDRLLRDVIDYETKNPNGINPKSPSLRVGVIPSKQIKFKKEKHIEKMYSLDNVFNISEFTNWYNKIDHTNYHNDMIAMHKYDGLSLNLYYENGILMKAITRGDGLVGENVTLNARQIKSIPIRINYLEPIEIRGEVLMPYAEFDRINLEKESRGEEIFASPRNAAVGSLRSLDPKVTRDRNLIFKCWGVGYGDLSKYLGKYQDPYKNNVSKAKHVYGRFSIREINSTDIIIVHSIYEVARLIGRSKLDITNTPIYSSRIWKTSKGVFEVTILDRIIPSPLLYLRSIQALPRSIQALSDEFDILIDLGFDIQYKRIDSIDDVDTYYNKILDNRDSLDYPIDGVVIKFNYIPLIEVLGYTNKYPKWAIAFKLPAMEKVSKLISVDNQVGKTGVVTPVANITGVDIDGVFVSKVTLHNYNEIKLKDLRINDKIIVIRSGDVIPKITTVLKDRRNGKEIEIIKPTHCPKCDSTLVEKGPNLFCINPDCKDIILGKLIHFVSRDGLNIDGMSEATLTAIMKKYNLPDFGSYIITIFSMTIDDILTLEGFSTKKANNLYNAIGKAKTVELYKLLDSLSIPNIGTTASKVIVRKYRTLDVLVSADLDSLLSIDGIGKVQAESFIRFMESNEELLWKLMMFGFNIINTLISDDRVLISATGTFPVSRKEVIDRTARYNNISNYEYTDKISKNVKLLIVGENPSSKLIKAEKLNIKILKWENIENE